MNEATRKVADNFRLRFCSHKALGGVTDQFFVLGCLDPSLSSKLQLAESPVKRNLISVLKTTEMGSPVPGRSPSVLPNGVLSLDKPVHSKHLVQRFRVPCVRLQSQLCDRFLTLGEIGAAMDLPVSSVKPFCIAAQINRDYVLEVTSLPPLKCLHSLANAVFNLSINVPVIKPCSGFAKLQGADLSPSIWSPKFLDAEDDHAAVADAHAKAVKADDAETNEELWNIRLAPFLAEPFRHDNHAVRLNVLRHFLFGLHCRRLFLSFRRFFLDKHGLSVMPTRLTSSNADMTRDLVVGVDAITRSCRGSFWNWSDGSTLFFWRWPEKYRLEARDGVAAFVDWSKMPSYKKPQRPNKDRSQLLLEAKKIMKVVTVRYVIDGLVRSLTGWFSVPKGLTDIRLVYDATACGLNKCLWAPKFWLPTNDDITDCATDHSFYGDVDGGEFFLNFPLDLRIQPFAGIDITPVSNLDSGNDPPVRVWKRWGRCAMGFMDSPYKTCRSMGVCLETVKGNRLDSLNVFHWTRAIENYPGTRSYDPSMPRVYKYNPITDTIAADTKGFVDDYRGVGPSKLLCEDVLHQLGSTMQAMGIQDASRKRRPVSQRPGAWTGTVTISVPKLGVFVKTMDCKWLKVKFILRKYTDFFDPSPVLAVNLVLKDLEIDVGFLVHVSMTYPQMKPYLKCFYLTMNSWRPFRDSHGWKLSGRALRAYCEASNTFDANSELSDDEDAPTFVRSVPDFRLYLRALSSLFNGDLPALRLVRGSSVNIVSYGFGDASGAGFGSSWMDGDSLVFRVGVWNKEGTDTSSNYRELRNCVETLEVMGMSGKLEGVELFFFTDNSVSESVSYRGNSTSPILFELILRLWSLEMKHKCKLHLIHVAGTRMIAQGTDGISRGDMMEGVLQGDDMLEHIPLALPPCERSATLLPWIKSWACESGFDVEVLEATDWFERGHDIKGGFLSPDKLWFPNYVPGCFIWQPAPAGASFAAKELRHARHKRTDSFHIFICPRLMEPEWSKHVHKSADLFLTIPVGEDYWSKDNHEPLRLAIYFPYVRAKPWELRSSPMLVDVGNKLHRMWKNGEGSEGDLLRKLFRIARGMASMPICDLCKMLSSKFDFDVPCLQNGRGKSAFVAKGIESTSQ